MIAEQMTQKDFLSLPHRNWDQIGCYHQLIVVPTGKKHDSGWGLMAIIGCNKEQEPVEIAAYCDDLCWLQLPENKEYSQLHCDMYYKSKCIRFWSNNYEFKVGLSLSSTDVRMIKINKTYGNNTQEIEKESIDYADKKLVSAQFGSIIYDATKKEFTRDDLAQAYKEGYKRAKNNPVY